MIICDKCKENTNENTLSFKGYFYPHRIPVSKGLDIDICEKCLKKIFGKEKVDKWIREVTSE